MFKDQTGDSVLELWDTDVLTSDDLLGQTPIDAIAGQRRQHLGRLPAAGRALSPDVQGRGCRRDRKPNCCAIWKIPTSERSPRWNTPTLSR